MEDIFGTTNTTHFVWTRLQLDIKIYMIPVLDGENSIYAVTVMQ